VQLWRSGVVSKLLFAFVGRVSTEDMQEPEASRARQIAKASTILPPSAQIVADYFDIGDTRALPWPRRPETGRLLRELRSGTNAWDAIVAGEFTRAFGAPIQYSTTSRCSSTSGSSYGSRRSEEKSTSARPPPRCCSGCSGVRRSKNAT
jgi:hypothetical protein